MTSSQATTAAGAVPAARAAPDGRPAARCPAGRSRWAPRPASTSASRARTSRSPPASPTASPCACSTRPARKPRSRCADNDADVWHAFVPGIGPGQAYGYRVGGPWDPARGLRCNPAKLLLDPYAKAISGTVSFGPGGARPGRGRPRPSRAPWTPSAHVPRSLVVDPAVRLAGRQPALVPLRGHGPLRDPRQGLHHAPPGHPARSCAGPTPAWATRPPSRTCWTWASPPSSCCPCTRTCPRRSWSGGA